MDKAVAVVTVLMMIACSPKQVVTAPAARTQGTTELLIEEKLGKDPEVSTNRDNSFTLYKKAAVNPSNNLPVLAYVVVRNDDRRIVEEGSITMGAIEWSAEYELEISQVQGQAQVGRPENTTRKRIDLRPYLARDGKR